MTWYFRFICQSNIVLFPFLNLIFSIIILPMKLSYRMRMLYMKFNDMNSICGSFGITFLVFIPIVVATNPVDFSSRFTLFCSFVNVTIFIHEKSIAEFAFDESANLQIFIWNQIGKKKYLRIEFQSSIARTLESLLNKLFRDISKV